jgi:hypothetical protein
MKMEQTDFSETQAYKIQTPGNYPEESIKRWNKLIETSVINPYPANVENRVS